MTPADHAAHYTTLGLALVSIEPRSKGPRSSGWQDNPITTPQAAHGFWRRHPQHNMGVLHGSSNTAALDIDHMEGARLALAEIGADLDRLLESPVRIRGAKGVKPLYNALGLVLSRKVLTWPHPDKAGHKLTVFELRGGAGCQDVLPPSIHPTGISYAWDGIAPSSREDLEDLPDVLIYLWENWEELRPVMEAACPWATEQPVRATVPSRSSVPHSPSPRAGESVIEAFNARFNASELLERNGYTQKGERWSAPTSESGMAGVVILEGKVYSHHSSDVLNEGHAHDAFSLFTLLEHGGDVRAATREAARVLGLGQGMGFRSEQPDQNKSPFQTVTRGGLGLGQNGRVFARESLTQTLRGVRSWRR